MEMFDELYYKRPSVTEFDARVVSAEPKGKKWEIVLDRTAFYPEGGGQPSDRGYLEVGGRRIRVSHATLKDGVVRHTTEEVTDVDEIEVGQQVHGVIDEKFRADNSAGHTGEHILSGLIHRKYGYENVGFHMSDVISIDISGPLTYEQLMEMEDAANEIIRRDLPVLEYLPTDEELETLDYRSKKELTGTVRIIEIPEADVCACCGTHVSRTGEIGLLKCLSIASYKGGVRIELLAGRPALLYVRKIMEQNSEISRLLSVKPQQTAAGVVRLQSEIAAEKERTTGFIGRYYESKAAAAEDGQALLIDFEENMNSMDIQRFADRFVKDGKAETAAVLTERNAKDPEEGYNYVIISRSRNLRDAAKTLNAALNGRGGGRDVSIQGFFRAEREQIEKVLRENLG